LKVIALPDPVAANSLPRASPPTDQYTVQAGAFSDRGRAQSVRDTLKDRFDDARVIQVTPLWRVLVGRRMTLDEATKLAARVRQAAGEAVVVRER
jgi:cell division septation protein DedD